MVNKPIEIFTKEPGKVHFIGIGGIGMAGLAYILYRFGYQVSGCDSVHTKLTEDLSNLGIKLDIGHTPSHANDFDKATDIVIITPAIAQDNPELLAFKNKGIPIFYRGHVLAALSNIRKMITVCGSHGKTTTSTLLASALKKISPQNIAWCIGGTSRDLPFPAGGDPKDENCIIVAEADESDGTLASYTPFINIIADIDLDHIDHFKDEEDFTSVFESAILATKDAIIYKADHNITNKIVRKATTTKISFGRTSSPHGISFDNICLLHNESRFTVSYSTPTTHEFCDVVLNIPGLHNIYNYSAALACILHLTNITLSQAVQTLSSVATLPARRFEIIPTSSGTTLISDYAHHPTEIAAFVKTASSFCNGKRIIGVFQPHRYTRTLNFINDFPPAFEGLDELIILPVYAASEKPVLGGYSADLYKSIREFQINNNSYCRTILAQNMQAAESYIKHNMRKDDAVLLIGAGDLIKLINPISSASICDTSCCTTRKIGGYGTSAPVAKITSDISEFLNSDFPKYIIGASTNCFIADTGFYGTILRLDQKHNFIEHLDSTHIRVGAFTPGAKLLNYCQENDLGGLEYMVDIPGVVGGWLAMNAGTKFGSFCDVVQEIQAINLSTNEEELIKRENLVAEYRHCHSMDNKLALSVTLELHNDTKENILNKIKSYKASRSNLHGLRSCGSVFKNPPNTIAGKLLDEAGCKGLRVGGAFVTDFHANIIATDATASSSDVLALIQIMQEKVFHKFGIKLSPEVNLI